MNCVDDDDGYVTIQGAAEAALKVATDNAAKEVEKTEKFVHDKLKEAMVNKYSSMVSFYKVRRCSIDICCL